MDFEEIFLDWVSGMLVLAFFVGSAALLFIYVKPWIAVPVILAVLAAGPIGYFIRHVGE